MAGKVRTKQGETPLNPVRNHVLQEQACKQVQKQDSDWITAMQEELHQFERNKVWRLVPRPAERTIIGTKWVFRNKLDESGTVTRNKARLVV